MLGSVTVRSLLCAATAGVLVMGVPAAATPAAAVAPARYTIVELSTPAGDTSSANAINNAGAVVGAVTTPAGVPQVSRWSAAGVRSDLPGLPGAAATGANGINDAGQVAGASARVGGTYAYPVRWSASGVVQSLGDTQVNRLGTGNALDPAGRVAGGQRPADSEGSPLGILYALDGTPTELGADAGIARAINGYDQVVGAFNFSWRAGVRTSLPALPGALPDSVTAYAINNAGWVAGAGGLPDGSGSHAVFWRGGAVTDIGTVDGIQYNTAKAINAAGQVVGTADPLCQPCVSPRAWIWAQGSAITPLDTLLPAGSGWTLREANGISDRGEVVGIGVHNGQTRAYRMTPVSSFAINFQPAGALVPPGYVADTGAAYGDRGSGRTFGWNTDNAANTRDRNAAGSPDQRYDTFNHMQKPGGATKWELAVPNGTYTVHIVAGDASSTDSTFRIAAESTQVVSGTPTSATHFVEGAARVTVTDGRLSITNASGSANNKINSIEVIGS